MAFPKRNAEDTSLCQAPGEGDRIELRPADRSALDIEVDQVRPWTAVSLRAAESFERVDAGGQAGRVGMILGETVDVMLERVQAGGRENSGLTHPAADRLAHAPRLVDERTGAAQDRAHRCAETLRQADRHLIGAVGECARLDVERNRSVEQARAVEVNGETVRLNKCTHAVTVLG